MKAKIKRGKSFGGVCRYVEDVGKLAKGDKQPELICSTLVAQTVQGRIRELTRIASTRPDIEKPVWHCSLSLPPGERLDSDKWAEVVRDFITGMGMNADLQPYYAVRHNDTDKDHVHIVLCRVREDGELFYGQRDVHKAIKVTQELETKHGLTETQGLSSRKAKKQVTSNEMQMAVRMGRAPPKARLQGLIDEVIKTNKTAGFFVKELERVGVGVIPAISPNGKLNGFSFELDGVVFKGSQLGKDYGLKSLLDRGLIYDKDRDREALDRAGERARSRVNSADQALARNAPVTPEKSRGRNGQGSQSNSEQDRDVDDRIRPRKRERQNVERSRVHRETDGGTQHRSEQDSIEVAIGKSDTIASRSNILDRGNVGGGDRHLHGTERESSDRDVATGSCVPQAINEHPQSPARSDDGFRAEAIDEHSESGQEARRTEKEGEQVNERRCVHNFETISCDVRRLHARAGFAIACLVTGATLFSVSGRIGGSVLGHQSSGQGKNASEHQKLSGLGRYLGNLWHRAISLLTLPARRLVFPGRSENDSLHMRSTDKNGGSNLRNKVNEGRRTQNGAFQQTKCLFGREAKAFIGGKGRKVDVHSVSSRLRNMASESSTEIIGRDSRETQTQGQSIGSPRQKGRSRR